MEGLEDYFHLKYLDICYSQGQTVDAGIVI